MNKGLEALKEHKGVLKILGHKYCEEWENLKDIEKELKALEIIKEKSVDVGFLQYCSTVETYNNYIIEHAWTKQTKKLTPEEYDLLKEALL